MKYCNYVKLDPHSSQSQWQRCLSRRYAAARLLRSWVRIPPRALMFVCCEWCVLSGRGLCYKLITSPKESYQLWCVVVCDLETSFMRRLWPTGGGGLLRQKQTNKQTSKRYTQQIFSWNLRSRYFVKKLPAFYTGQGFISVQKENPKLGPVSEINSVNNIKLY